MPIRRFDALQQFAAVDVLSDPGYLPGPAVIPNACMVRLNWSLVNGRIAHNILYAQYSGSPALSTALADTIFTGITNPAQWTALAAFLAPGCQLTGVTLVDVRSLTGLEFTSTAAAKPGTGAGKAMPDEVALVVTLKTNTRGASGRGRFYIPGWTGDAVGANGVVLAGAVTAASNWADGVVRPAITGTIGAMALGLRGRQAYTSPITGRQFPARQATTLPILAATVKDNHWDSQRRRGLK